MNAFLFLLRLHLNFQKSEVIRVNVDVGLV